MKRVILLRHMNSEKETLKEEIAALEAQIEPKQKRLSEIYLEESADIQAKIGRVHKLQDKFDLSELVYASHSRCLCGAGMAYPKDVGGWGAWYCGDILLGRAIRKGQEGAREHEVALPFTFYEIKSENQPSANGATTRPEK